MRLLREVRDHYPDALTVPCTRQRHHDIKKRADAHGYVLDTSYRQGTLTIRYIGQRTKGTR